MSGIEYNSASGTNRRVEAIYHSEGRFFNTNTGTTTPTYRTEYTIKDHLGNARVTFADLNSNGKVDLTNSTTDSEIIQENHYYAFGMAHEGPWLMNNGAAKDNFYQYNSKEYNNDHGLNWNDYGARWYDPAVGRFTGVDPLASKYPSLSPYCFVANNPLIYVDPDGRDIQLASEVIDGKTVITVTVTGKLINESGTAYTQEQLQSYTDRLVSSIASTYTGSDGDVSWKGVDNITVATEDNKLSATDHAFKIVDKDKIPDGAGGFEAEGTLGKAPFGENAVYLSQHMLDRTQATEGDYTGTGKTSSGTGTLERTGPHELGHSGNLKHPTPGTMDGNLMHQTKQPNAGTKLTKDQILEIKKAYDDGKLNQGKQKIE